MAKQTTKKDKWTPPGGHKNPVGLTHASAGRTRGVVAQMAALTARVDHLEDWARTLFTPETPPASFERRKVQR